MRFVKVLFGKTDKKKEGEEEEDLIHKTVDSEPIYKSEEDDFIESPEVHEIERLSGIQNLNPKYNKNVKRASNGRFISKNI